MAEVKTVQVNLWKELHREINKTLDDLRGLVLLTHNSVEFEDIVDFLNQVRRDEEQTVMYISLINSYNKIKSVLEKKPLKSKKLMVVDTVSGFVIEIQDTVDCVYRRPPESFEDMKNLILNNINIVNPNIVVVDSLTQFINFSNPREDQLHELYRFLKSMKEDAMDITNDLVFLLYDDKMGSMRRLPVLFTNCILKLEVIKDIPEWRD